MNKPIFLFFLPNLLIHTSSSNADGEVEVSATFSLHRLHGHRSWVEERHCVVFLLKGKHHHPESLEKPLEEEPQINQ